MNTFLAIVLFLMAATVAFLLTSAFLWWLVPLAFPALSFGFGNAMALTGIVWLVMAGASARS